MQRILYRILLFTFSTRLLVYDGIDSKFVSSRERKTSLKVHLSLVPISSLHRDKFTLIGRSRFHDASPSNGLTYGALKTPLEDIVRKRRFEQPIGKLRSSFPWYRKFDLTKPLSLDDSVFSDLSYTEPLTCYLCFRIRQIGKYAVV